MAKDERAAQRDEPSGEATTTTVVSEELFASSGCAEGPTKEDLALVILWSKAEPERAGEAAIIPSQDPPQTLGRSARGEHRVSFFRQRPGVLLPTSPLAGSGISREQLRLKVLGPSSLGVERVGRCPTLINGAEADSGTVDPGDTIMLRNQLLLLCVKRPFRLPQLPDPERMEEVPFGRADQFGIVGESPAAWALRGQLTFLGPRQGHVLVHGPSGTGKELVSRALHSLSPRRKGPWISRNAATFPETLIDAEVFGNIRDYPNPGMRQRPGLIGEADGGTLFLDEIGELPDALQAHLLRVLDAEGSYQRLGEGQQRYADLRILAATNRDPSALRKDFLARLSIRITLCGLNERQEDIPLLIHHLLRTAQSEDPDLAARFVDDRTGQTRIDPRLVDLLTRHTYESHIRELEALLWRAMTESAQHYIGLGASMEKELRHKGEKSTPPSSRAPESLSREEIVDALNKHDGNQARAFRELGLASRHVLYRLVKKHQIKIG